MRDNYVNLIKSQENPTKDTKRIVKSSFQGSATFALTESYPEFDQKKSIEILKAKFHPNTRISPHALRKFFSPTSK